MEVTFRDARPEDVEDAVPLIYSSGPAAFDYVFSHGTRVNARGFLGRAFVDERGEFSYRHHRVAVWEGEIVGVGACFSGEDARYFTVPVLRQIFGCYGPVTGLAVVRRGLQVERTVEPPKGRLHYIAHLGVVPELRGRGIGAQLVEHLLGIGRVQGRTTAGLDVAVTNPRAQRLYERLGFAVVRELESRYENATAVVPSHRRMERAIS